MDGLKIIRFKDRRLYISSMKERAWLHGAYPLSKSKWSFLYSPGSLILFPRSLSISLGQPQFLRFITATVNDGGVGGCLTGAPGWNKKFIKPRCRNDGWLEENCLCSFVFFFFSAFTLFFHALLWLLHPLLIFPFLSLQPHHPPPLSLCSHFNQLKRSRRRAETLSRRLDFFSQVRALISVPVIMSWISWTALCCFVIVKSSGSIERLCLSV